MNRELSLGIFLPLEKLSKNELKKLEEVKNWIEGISVKKILFAFPNLSEKFKEEIKQVFSNEDKIELIFKRGETRFLEKINDFLKLYEEKENLIDDLNEKTLGSVFREKNLDIIIKFGEKRIPSNFIWEKSYSEFFFVEKLENFDKRLLLDIVEEFKERERRFGE